MKNLRGEGIYHIVTTNNIYLYFYNFSVDTLKKVKPILSLIYLSSLFENNIFSKF